MEPPLVSIVIPTYNRPALLQQTLESIYQQDFRNYEILVVDDGTPGNKNELICNNYDKVRYLKIENSGGPSKPRNVGIENSQGKYVAFVDDDDLWLPNKLSSQLRVLEEDPQIGLVHGCCKLMDAQGNLSSTIIGRPGNPNDKSGKVTMRMVGNWTLMTSTVIVRSEVLDKVGFFNEEMPPVGEDTEFWVRCSLHAHFQYLDDPMVLYREHDGTSVQLNKKYIYVPTYLKEVIKGAFGEGLLSKVEYRALSTNLERMQIKKIKLGFFKTLGLLFRLNPLWFLNLGNIKLLFRKIIAPKK